MADLGPIDYAMAEAWLNELRFCVVTSLRRDGSPFGVPLGYLYEDRALYLSIGKVLAGRPATGITRLRRDPRVSIVISSEPARSPDDWIADPVHRRPSSISVHGRVEEHADDGDRVSRLILRRYLGHVLTGEGEYEEFEHHWLGLGGPPEQNTTGRVVFRIPVDEQTAVGGPLGRR
jgi:nitroimidazol reductase NimA-like FMN-containing flavoprotein (pyridoxamine 5'-phosphate oxidase superfamily)